MLELNIPKKEQIDKRVVKLNFNINNIMEHKIVYIQKNAVCAAKIENYLFDFHYLVA